MNRNYLPILKYKNEFYGKGERYVFDFIQILYTCNFLVT